MRLALTAVCVAALVILCSCAGAQASTFVGGTNDLTLVGTPQVVTVLVGTALSVTYHNNLPVPVSGVIVMVVHNSLGQTLQIATSTFGPINASSIAAGPNFLVPYGLAQASYNVSVFAMSFSGVALSNSSIGVYTL